MLTKESLQEARQSAKRSAPAMNSRRARATGQPAGHFRDLPLTPPDEYAGDRREEPFPNLAIALILSSMAGFTIAVFAAIVGSGHLNAILIYLGVSVAGPLVLLAIAWFRNFASGDGAVRASADASIVCDAKKAHQVIYAQNQRKRVWYGLTLGLVMAGVWITGRWAIAGVILAACLAAFPWSDSSRRRGSRQAGTPGAWRSQARHEYKRPRGESAHGRGC